MSTAIATPSRGVSSVLLSQTFAYDASDSAELRRKKHALFLVAGACSVAGVAWSGMYWLIFGWGLTTALPLSFSVIVGSALVVSNRTRDHRYAVYAQIVCIMYVTAFIQWSIGGVFDSGFVLAWAFVGPISALVFFSLRASALCFLLYLVNVAITVVFNDTFVAHGLQVDETVRQLFFVANLCTSSFVVLLFASYYVHSAAFERRRADALQHDLDEEKAKQLGPYTLEFKLGQGGMGIVYRARHALLRRPTAVKLLSTDDASREDLARFEREVQLTSELSHPNIVAVYDYGHSPEGEFYYAMEYLPGIDLESLVSDWGPMLPERAVPILIQICDALDEAHHRSLVHRDIKPGNIIVSRIGKRLDVVKVLDFGLVKEVDGPSDLTGENHIAGTPAYISPEALVAPDRVGAASDLYAVGAVAFFLLTGERVFDGKTVAEVCAHHIHTEPRPPSLLSEHELAPGLDSLVLRCLAKSPDDRYASAGHVRDALATIQVPSYDDGSDWWDAYESSREGEPETQAALPDALALTVDGRGR